METRIRELEMQIKEKVASIEEMEREKVLLIEELVNLKIHPLKLGSRVMCEIPRGRGKKWCECILESEFGDIYARPVKNDGTLDNKHFYLCQADNKERLNECIR